MEPKVKAGSYSFQLPCQENNCQPLVCQWYYFYHFTKFTLICKTPILTGGIFAVQVEVYLTVHIKTRKLINIPSCNNGHCGVLWTV